ncbi:hypothetical protein NMY22_g13945 [Coprinellus aureogranulatus]|nr:hypothetical protein NMY22_g13945 [Coprinellus aureogranulatus]
MNVRSSPSHLLGNVPEDVFREICGWLDQGRWGQKGDHCNLALMCRQARSIVEPLMYRDIVLVDSNWALFDREESAIFDESSSIASGDNEGDNFYEAEDADYDDEDGDHHSANGSFANGETIGQSREANGPMDSFDDADEGVVFSPRKRPPVGDGDEGTCTQ